MSAPFSQRRSLMRSTEECNTMNHLKELSEAISLVRSDNGLIYGVSADTMIGVKEVQTCLKTSPPKL